MIPLIAYADRLSARPGETIAFKVSSTGPEPYTARLVRVICGDPNPDGPGMKYEPVDADFAGEYPSRPQGVALGSYGVVDIGTALNGVESFTLTAIIWPTMPKKEGQGILGRFGHDAGAGFALCIGPQGAELRIGQGGDDVRCVAVGKPLANRQWYRIWASFDALSGQITVGQQDLGPASVRDDCGVVQQVMEGPPVLQTDGRLLIAALGGDPVQGHFNGKIEAPAIYAGVQDPENPNAAACLARWDFASDTMTTRIIDAGPSALNGHLINAPARAMTGASWRAQETCWRHAPEHYGAIHFHDDDIEDCHWQTDFTFTVSDGFKSGVYAARLECGEHWEAVPFFVCPPKGAAQADLCVVVPTFTYVIYGNQERYDFGDHWRQRAKEWGAFPYSPNDHPEYGLSTYNFHTDGSGICNATWHRPMLNVRPGYFPIAEPRGSGLRHFPADTHLFDWLETKGIAFDVVTDWELHHDGADVLRPYKAVTTCSHPEYHTAETLDALMEYRDSGGKLAYLGGNGFYWKVALHPEKDGLIEMRRGEDGLRAWASEPGEYYNAFDGTYGGLWRRNGRPPQQLCGVGFSSQGGFEGTHYRKAPGADDPSVSWIFEGVEDDVIGDFGLSGGGAAGYELDRADIRLGTPETAIVLATSEDPGDSFILVPEEVLTHVSTLPGEPAEELIRADMVYFDCPGGGAVFSVGSITFCGSLSHNGYDNNVSRILENVLRRFLT